MIIHDLELLAPAGKWDVLERVAHAGADAVYAGGKRFNMRMLRPDFNFSDEELFRAAEFLHEKGKRLYITVNNLYSGDEIAELRDYLYYLQEIKADALIIQDLAVARLHQELNLDIPMHASVQMGVANSSAVKFLESLGFSRIILSKNLSQQEIKDIHTNIDIGIEFFAHGDLCISHTGQCYLSSMLTGESANRGRCVKPCRWNYRLESEGILRDPGYFLAHKDLCVYQYLYELAEAGVQSYKIEGRMRDADYISLLIRTYRQALDRIINEQDDYQTDRFELQCLEENRIRDFSSANLFSTIQIDSIGLDGSREPRFPTAPVPVTKLTEEHFQEYSAGPLQVPQLIVKVGDIHCMKRLLHHKVDMMVMSLDRFHQGNAGWSDLDLERAVELCNSSHLSFMIETPRIVTQKDLSRVKHMLDRIIEYHPSAVIVNDLGSMYEADLRGLPVYGGAGLNVNNSQAAEVLKDHAMDRFTISVEAAFADVLEMVDAGLSLDVVVHGPQCGLITDLCLLRAGAQCYEDPCPVHCQEGMAYLWDELGQRYPIRSDHQCRNHLFNPLEISLYPFLPVLSQVGVAGIRIEGQFSQPEHLAQVVDIFNQGREQLRQGTWAKITYQQLLASYPEGLTPGWFIGKYCD